MNCIYGAGRARAEVYGCRRIACGDQRTAVKVSVYFADEFPMHSRNSTRRRAKVLAVSSSNEEGDAEKRPLSDIDSKDRMRCSMS